MTGAAYFASQNGAYRPTFMIASNVWVGSRCAADSLVSASSAAALLTTMSIVP